MPSSEPLGAVDELVDEAVDDGQRVVAVAAARPAARPTWRISPRRLTRAPVNVALAEVEPDDLARVVDDPEQDRRLAAARRPAADLLAPGRRSRSSPTTSLTVVRVRSGQARDVGAAHRPEVVERPQDEALVVLARLLVRRLWRLRHEALHERSHRSAAPRGLCKSS